MYGPSAVAGETTSSRLSQTQLARVHLTDGPDFEYLSRPAMMERTQGQP